MTELTGSGAITEQYLAEAEVLKPILENHDLDYKQRMKLQDAGLKALIKDQEVVS